MYDYIIFEIVQATNELSELWNWLFIWSDYYCNSTRNNGWSMVNERLKYAMPGHSDLRLLI